MSAHPCQLYDMAAGRLLNRFQHRWVLVSHGPKKLRYKCKDCGQGHTRWRPGQKPQR